MRQKGHRQKKESVLQFFAIAYRLDIVLKALKGLYWRNYGLLWEYRVNFWDDESSLLIWAFTTRAAQKYNGRLFF